MTTVNIKAYTLTWI